MNKGSHLYFYLFLVFGLLASLFFFLHFSQNSTYQIYSVIFGCVFYSVWGIIHGFLEHRINRQVAFEYIALSIFVFALLFVSISLK